MDLIEKLDNLLNKDFVNLEVNDNFYNENTNNVNHLHDDNVAEKEDDAKLIIDDKMKDRIKGKDMQYDNDEFQDCFVFSDDEDNDDDFDFLTSDDDDITEEGIKKSDSIETFLIDCEKITMDNSDCETQYDGINLQILEEDKNSEIIKNTEQDVDINLLNEAFEQENIEKQIESSITFPDKIMDLYDSDFESLQLRIDDLWKQIDEIQEQIKEEKEYSKREASAIKEFISKSNKNKSSKTKNDTNIKNILDDEPNIKDEQTFVHRNKIMETKGTNTFISAQTEARINAKKEELKRMSVKNQESEANTFIRKLKEVEELFIDEMNKVTGIITELELYKNAINTINYESRPEKPADQLNLYKYPTRNKSNLSLPDAKHLANIINDNIKNECNEMNFLKYINNST